MDQGNVIFADWGSTSGRLFLCEREDNEWRLLDQARIPGTHKASDPQAAFLSVTQNWRDQYSIERGLICGAITSNIGWIETPYLNAPCDPRTLIDLVKHHTIDGLRVDFLPGVKIKTNPLGLPDTMRGEEVQVLGWICAHPQKSAWLCLPGTHSKWVRVENGQIISFISSMAGELFHLLATQSVLAQASTQINHHKAFARGLTMALRTDALSLTHALYTARALSLQGEIATKHIPSLLSGLIIGDDIRGGLEAGCEGPVHLIGETKLCSLYQTGLNMAGHTSHIHDGNDCVIKGLQALIDG